MKNKSLLSIVLLLISVTAFSQVTNTLSLNDTLNVKATLIHSEDFDRDLSKWVKCMSSNKVNFRDNKVSYIINT